MMLVICVCLLLRREVVSEAECRDSIWSVVFGAAGVGAYIFGYWKAIESAEM